MEEMNDKGSQEGAKIEEERGEKFTEISRCVLPEVCNAVRC